MLIRLRRCAEVRDELEDQQWFIRTGAVRPEIRIRTLSDLSGYDGLNIQGYREGQSRPLFRLGPQSRTITTIVQRVRRSDIFGREVLLVFDEGRPYWVASAAAQVGEQTIELLATIDATSQYSRIGALVDSSLYLVAGENKVPPFTLYELEPHAGFFDAGLQAGMQSAEIMFMILTDKGMKAVLEDEFKIGANVGISIGSVGAGLQDDRLGSARNSAPLGQSLAS